jgi:hypothetical protein
MDDVSSYFERDVARPFEQLDHSLERSVEHCRFVHLYKKLPFSKLAGAVRYTSRLNM